MSNEQIVVNSHTPMPIRSPDLTWNEISFSTAGPSCMRYQAWDSAPVTEKRTTEYRAVTLSTLRSPLEGQYAGGVPPSVGCGSCSMDTYCAIRSTLFPSIDD